MVDCEHWSGKPGAICGTCALGRYGGRPSRGVCLAVCPLYRGAERLEAPRPPTLRQRVLRRLRLGSVVYLVTQRLGMRHCRRCRKRRRRWDGRG